AKVASGTSDKSITFPETGANKLNVFLNNPNKISPPSID
ncbi:MAG: hypothetical protein K0Q97_2687, partial [Bacillota bacterium]|nr:hypothetical protein [Bacillota bacterium]